MGFRIDTLWAFTHVDENDVEGIVGFHTGSGWMPMIAADRDRIESLRPLAERLARETGRPIKFSAFTTRTDLEDVTP